MKEKLKMLFAVLRSFGFEKLETRIGMDRDYIEDWDRKLSVGNEKEFKIPSFIEKIIEYLIKTYYSEMDEIDLDIDEWWYLYIDFYPKENKLVFQGSHKVENSESFSKIFDWKDFDEEIKNKIHLLDNEYPDTEKFDFEMFGRWDDGEVYEFEVDGRKKSITAEIDEILWLIGNDIMEKIHGRYWNEGPGGSLDCRLWGSTIITKGVILTEEYEDSGMYFEVTLDNIENFD
jgi:hypothetical protein